jgi:hypothetical protein
MEVILKALRMPKFRFSLLISMLNWFSNTFVYNGISFNIGSLSGDPYINYVIGLGVETVAIVMCMIAFEKLRRKPTYSVCLFGVGFSLISIAFVPSRKYNETEHYYALYWL